MQPESALLRPRVRGKFLFLGDQKFTVRGVTYGTFRPSPDGPFPDRAVVEQDFSRMAAAGLNAVRTYEVPPAWLLETANHHGLRVMVGLAWEQHVAFLDDSRLVRTIERRVREGVEACAEMGHAVLCYAVGNEIPAPIVRWHGHVRVERFLRRLSDAVHEADPEGLVTYVNYPSTEYLDLSFLDFQCFNVFLESQSKLAAYIARLQNIAGDGPLVLAEIGLDSLRNGELGQARSVAWQIETALDAACAGAFVFSWTDEWYRGGYDIDDWEFGLTDRARRPKPALAAASAAFAKEPGPSDHDAWPPVSVVLCSHNGARTIGDTLAGLSQLSYPEYEVIVVDDGSTDATAEIARSYDCRVISTENQGLAIARNTGLAAATGEVVAYIDDDAKPDPDWLRHLATTFLETGHAGVGGPNIPPPGEGFVATCVANAPGGPIHVLLSDREAEHIPGCNMAFRKECLNAVGGFDPSFRAAGDDVDICWTLQRAGWTLGYSPGAVVLHSRRSTIRAYLRQQRSYGRAEALLERKWPERYNVAGHLTWAGRVYSDARAQPFGRRWRVYYGTWGGALFQRRHPRRASILASTLITPEYYLLLAVLLAVGSLEVLWSPLMSLFAFVALGLGSLVWQAAASARRAIASDPTRGRLPRAKLWMLATALHVLQPAARLRGRLGSGLTPWRRPSKAPAFTLPRIREVEVWSESWTPPQARLRALEKDLRRQVTVVRGGDYDRWDLEVSGGVLGRMRVRSMHEDHEGGRQLVRFRLWPRFAAVGIGVLALFASLTVTAAALHAWAGAIGLGLVFAAASVRLLRDCAVASALVLATIQTRADADGDDVLRRRRRRVAPWPVSAPAAPVQADDEPQAASELRVGEPVRSAR